MSDSGIAIPVSIEADAATITIEKLAAKVLDLEGKVSELGRKGKKAGEDLGTGFGQGLGQKAFDTFKNWLEGIPGALDRALHSSAAWADNLQELGQRSGFATKQLQEYALAAKTSGLNLNSLTRYAQQLQPQLLKNAQAFKDIGLSFEEMAGLDPGQQFDKVARSLAKISDPTARLKATVELFGKRLGPQLQPFIDGLEAARKRAEELGLVLDEKTVKAAAEFNDELDTLKETQEGVVRSFGNFIAADEDLRDVLKDVTNEIGSFNKWVQEVGANFHELPKGVKVATAGIVLFGAKLIGAIPTIASFVALAAQIKTLGGLGAIWTAISGGLVSVKVAALGASKALLGFLANPVVLAAVAGAVAGGALGLWLRDNVEWFREMTDAIGDAAAAAAKFFGLMPSEKARGGAFAGLEGQAFTDAVAKHNAEQAKKREEAAAGVAAAPARIDPEDLKRAKELAGLENQLAAIGAQRAGTEAAARQSRENAVEMARLDFQIQKQALDDKAALGEKVNKAEYDQLVRVRDLTIAIANAQEAAALRAAKVADRTRELEASKALADLEVQIGDARKYGLTTLEQIEDKRQSAIEKAQAEHDLTVEKLRAEIELGQLTGKARADKEKDIAQADAVLAKQKELADVTLETAMAERAWAEAKKYGVDLSERGLKAQREVIEEIDRALANPKALIPPGVLTDLETMVEKAKRLGQPFEELQARADEAFRRIEDQGVQQALDSIGDKLRRGVRLTPSDLEGLIKMRDGLSVGSQKARELEERIRLLSAAMRQIGREDLVRNTALNIVQQQIEMEDQKWLRTKAGLALLEREVYLRLLAAGYTEEQAKKIAHAQVAQMKANQVLGDTERILGIIGGLFDAIGVSAHTAAAQILDMAAAALQAAKAGQAAKDAWAKGDKIGAIGAGVSVVGNIIKGGQTQDAGKGALQGAAQGAAFGSAFGPWGAAIGGLAGGLIGFFSGSKFRKIAKDAGKVLGEGLSDETIKKIEADSKRLGISTSKAALLSIGEAMADTNKKAADFAPQVSQLMTAIADGSIPAKEGLAEVGEAFVQIADDALKAGRVGDRVMVGLIKQARALGLESPEMKAFVSEQLDAATEGVHKFVASLSALSEDGIKKIGKDAGVVFGAMFDALVSEKGIVAAVDALKGDFDTLRETLTKTLGQETMEQILGPFGAAFDTIGNEKLRPLFEGIDGITQAMKGLANSGYLSLDAFTAMQDATATLFDEAIAGGADMKTALLAVAPGIQAAISAAEQFGVPLDEDTQRLKDLAEQNGITFKTDPQQAMLDVLVSIAEVLGADIPESAKRAAQSLQALKDATPGEVNVGGGGSTGGSDGNKNVQANVTVNLGINENPLAAADTAAQMRAATVEWTADALQDRIPSIVAAIEGAMS